METSNPWPSERIAALIAQTPVSMRDLSLITGFSLKTVRGTLYNLRASGHAARNPKTGEWVAVCEPFKRYVERARYPRKVAA